jgi:creatinine amidohydrolase/Fe(II)-dependent formamide hydrolase-like protein
MSMVIAPSFAYGATGYALSGPELGTIDPDNLAFETLVKSVLRALCAIGFQRIAVCVHHQGMDGPLALAFRKAAAELLFELPREEKGVGWWGRELDTADRAYHFNRLRVLPTHLPATRLDPRELGGGHAGRFETSLLLAARPDCVDMSKLSSQELPWFCTEYPAAEATRELGERALEAMAAAWEAELRAWA